MPHQTGLPDALRRFGLAVELVPGWETRGSSSFTPRGPFTHHTAGPATGDRPSLAICVNGRSDLPGPLCNVFLCRHGHAIVVAAGRANHGGPGNWLGLSGNSMFFGTEAESTGKGDWTPEQLWAFPRVHAAYHSLPDMFGPVHCCAHREYATPPGRKPDPVGIDMPSFRANVTRLLADPDGDDMPLSDEDVNRVAWSVWAVISNSSGGNATHAQLSAAANAPAGVMNFPMPATNNQHFHAVISDLYQRVVEIQKQLDKKADQPTPPPTG